MGLGHTCQQFGPQLFWIMAGLWPMSLHKSLQWRQAVQMSTRQLCMRQACPS